MSEKTIEQEIDETEKKVVGIQDQILATGEISSDTWGLIAEYIYASIRLGKLDTAKSLGNIDFNKLTLPPIDSSVDARGSSDPSQTMAIVERGILAAAPYIIAATKKSIHAERLLVDPSPRR